MIFGLLCLFQPPYQPSSYVYYLRLFRDSAFTQEIHFDSVAVDTTVYVEAGTVQGEPRIVFRVCQVQASKTYYYR